MGPKRTAGSRSPSKPGRSPAKRIAPTGRHENRINGSNQTTSQPATARNHSLPTPPPSTSEPFTFRGHLQPPIDQRLFAAKNFLADGDPDRYLHFDTKITQVKELVEQIEKDRLYCDSRLLRDVKVRLEVHRDWKARRKTSAFDIGACEAPLIAPFSTRLINADKASAFRQEQGTAGFGPQTREDHAPFSVHREDDDVAFLDKMKEEARTYANGIEHNRGLIEREDEAYQWAMRDPASISYWMQPNNDSPLRGVSRTYSQDSLQVLGSGQQNRRLSRSWVPGYVAATEAKINALLMKETPSGEEFAQLQELLSPLEPEDLRNLHTEHDSFTEAAISGELNLSHAAPQLQIRTEFSSAWLSWVSLLASYGVHFIMRTPGEPEVIEEGIFYVDDGIMTQEHRNTLHQAQILLDRLLTNGRMDLTEQESSSLDSLMLSSLPNDILETRRAMVRIFEVNCVNCVSDLDQESHTGFLELEKMEQEERLRWEDELRHSGKAEFRYLRPAEMKAERNNVLYLPWDFSAVPQVQISAWSELDLPPDVQKLQDHINKDLPRKINLPNLDTGSPAFRKLLEQLVYPDLRDLLTPYLALRAKKTSRGPLSDVEARKYDVLAKMVIQLLEAWWKGLGSKITIKIPRPEQQDESPGTIYCRRPNKSVGEDLASYIMRKKDSINQLFQSHASLPSGSEPLEYYEQLNKLCDDLQYPALKTLEGRYQKCYSMQEEEVGDRLHHDWDTAFKRWIQSKKGQTIKIKVPNPRIDPDDDPSVVYYRGPLTAASDFGGLSEDMRVTLGSYQASTLPSLSVPLRGRLPPLLNRLIGAFETTKLPASEAVLQWHFDAFMNGPLLPTFNSTSLNVPDSEIGIPVGHPGHGTGTSFLSPEIQLQTNFARLGVDLTAFLPEIRKVEAEINHLLSIVLDIDTGKLPPTHEGDPKTLTIVLNQQRSHNRLASLLRQFWPNYVYQKWTRAQQYKSEFGFERNDSQISLEEYKENISACDKDFMVAHNTWVSELRSTGVHIRISEEEAFPLGKTTLAFHPSTSIIPKKTRPDPIFCVLTPELSAGSDVHTSRLVYVSVNDTPPSSTTINYSAKLRAKINDLERRINSLFLKQKSTKLSWDESDALLDLFRPLLSPYLVDLDSKLGSLDEKARRVLMNDHESQEWIGLWNAWHRGYQSWMNKFPIDGIIIDKGDQIGHPAGVLRLRTDEIPDLTSTSRSKNIPVKLKLRENWVNRMLANRTQLVGMIGEQIDEILAPLFRPTLKRFRSMVHEHIRKRICQRSTFAPEDHALIEATISISHEFLKEIILESKATRKVRFLEPVPGVFEIDAVDEVGKVIFPASEEQQNSIALGLFEQLCPSSLDDGKIRFHDLVFCVRTDIAFRHEDLYFLSQSIGDISSTGILEYTTKIITLLGTLKQSARYTKQIQNDLANAMEKLFWKRLMWADWGLCTKILTILGNPIVFDRTPLLAARRLSGAAQLSLPPLAAPPRELEVKELEIELNNLLYREKVKTINKEQQDKLNYVLRALLPPHLRSLRNRIDTLARYYLEMAGLDLQKSLELTDAEDLFEKEFKTWKRGTSDLGIVLDSWMATSSAIAGACSHARHWKKLASAGGMTESERISKQLEDGNVQLCHDLYTQFRALVEDECRGLDDATKQLALQFLPQEIMNQAKQNTLQIQSTQSSSESDQIAKAMLLQTMKEQLIKSFVKWLTSLEPEQLRKLRIQTRTSRGDEIEFGPKAERRGIQRAAIELALNLLATNQEQHRPHDRFRMLDLPATTVYSEVEVPLCMPLKPHERPLEQDPFAYTRKMLALRRQKDKDYHALQQWTGNYRNTFSDLLPAPYNRMGPTSAATVDDMHTATRLRLNLLADIQQNLLEAVKVAPRPLLQELLLLVDAGLNHDIVPHVFDDDVELTGSDHHDLRELTYPSWDESRLEYGDVIPRVQSTPEDHAQLEQFEKEISELLEMPTWKPAPESYRRSDDNQPFAQIKHDPTVPSIQRKSGYDVRQAIGHQRLREAGFDVMVPDPWPLRIVQRYLRAMASAGRIHLDECENDEEGDGDVYVSRIPLEGHTENQYVVSRAAASSSPGVFYDEQGKLQVRSNRDGWPNHAGPPIVQANKHHYLQRLAFRLGRDLKDTAKILADEDPTLIQRTECQLKASAAAEAEMEVRWAKDKSKNFRGCLDERKENFTLQTIAQKLHSLAPDLAQDAGFHINSLSEMIEQEAAALLQIQILEEVSNDWELKFPEDEHVWDFAEDRFLIDWAAQWPEGPKITQYFHMRRFPPYYQSVGSKTAIEASGPIIQEKTEPAARAVQGITERNVVDHSKKKARHIRGSEPNFTLGESAYERAFLSWRMTQELKDVPEFQPGKKKRRSWFQFGHSKDEDENEGVRNRYPLPKIPADWIPDNVSVAEKRAHVLELAKKTPAFPNPQILEYYHTPEEIERLKIQQAWDDFAARRKKANIAVEILMKKKISALTPEELGAAYDQLRIHPQSGVFFNQTKP